MSQTDVLLSPRYKADYCVQLNEQLFFVKQLPSGVQIKERYLHDRGPSAGGLIWYTRVIWHSRRNRNRSPEVDAILAKAPAHVQLTF